MEEKPINFEVKSLDDFLLNERAKRIIKNITQKNQFPNSFLIEGKKGSGRKTLARLIAALALCDEEEKSFSCNSCHKVLSSIHPDVYEYFPKTQKDYAIGVVREISKKAYIKPNEGKRNVFILPETELLSEKSQNALLKIIEEPPNGSLFIFTSENRNSLLPTVLSRASVLTLDTPTEKEKEDFLFSLRERGKIPKETKDQDILMAAKISKGGFGDALSLLGKSEEREIYQRAYSLALAISQGKEYDALKLSEEIIKSKLPLDKVFRHLKEIFENEARLILTKRKSCQGFGKLSGKSCLRISEKAEESGYFLSCNCGSSIVFSAFISSLF